MGGIDELENPSFLGKNLRITVAASQGGRRYMEDRFLVHTERNEDNSIKWTFLGVFDGHGGEHASEFVRQNLLKNICNSPKFKSKSDKEILESIREGFLATHNMMRDVHDEWPYTASGYPSTAGTTVSCVFIRNGKLYTGHVGDSAIYLGEFGENGVRSVPLTVDHKPESVVEQLRIQKSGGSTAVKSGVTRVVWCRPTKSHQNGSLRRSAPMETIPFLSVARSLGDLWSYCESTKSYVVSPDPDVDVHILQKHDFCLVLASDGLTNVLSGEHAVNIVLQEEDAIEFDNSTNRNHARCLLKIALQNWRTLRADNVTVATVLFDSGTTTYQSSDLIKKLKQNESVDQALTDRPDAMLFVNNKENVLLKTQRTPVIYNGSKDANFCRVSYRGPGFRTHEEELNEEKRNIMIRKVIRPNMIEVPTGFELNEDIEYDDDEDDGDEGGGGYSTPTSEISLPIKNESTIQLRVANEIKMSGSSMSQLVEARIVMMESPIRPSAPDLFSTKPIHSLSIEPDEGTDEEDDRKESASNNKSAKPSPSKTPSGNTVRRVKAEACRRIRTPKATVVSTLPRKIESPIIDRRLTRSATKRSATSETEKKKTTSLRRQKSLEIVPSGTQGKKNSSLQKSVKTTPVKIEKTVPTPVRRSARRIAINECKSAEAEVPRNFSTPKNVVVNGPAIKSSRKRGRVEMLNNDEDMNDGITATGITPAIKNITMSGKTKSAPSTPKKAEFNGVKDKRLSKWSLSKLDSPNERSGNKEDFIMRVSEIADDYEDDVMVEPPSKIRRIYGFMKRLVGWPSEKQKGSH